MQSPLCSPPADRHVGVSLGRCGGRGPGTHVHGAGQRARQELQRRERPGLRGREGPLARVSRPSSRFPVGETGPAGAPGPGSGEGTRGGTSLAGPGPTRPHPSAVPAPQPRSAARVTCTLGAADRSRIPRRVGHKGPRGLHSPQTSRASYCRHGNRALLLRRLPRPKISSPRFASAADFADFLRLVALSFFN